MNWLFRELGNESGAMYITKIFHVINMKTSNDILIRAMPNGVHMWTADYSILGRIIQCYANQMGL